MKLTDIVAISGKSGLHKIIGRTKTGLIVESLVEAGKRFATSIHDKVSVLDDISMYTENGDMKLAEVLLKIHEKGDVPGAKDDSATQRAYLVDVIALDSARVYDSDIKKLLSWYHILASVTDIRDLVAEENTAEEQTSEPVMEETKATDTETEKPKKAAKKTTKKSEKDEADESKESEAKPKTTRKKKTEE